MYRLMGEMDKETLNIENHAIAIFYLSIDTTSKTAVCLTLENQDLFYAVKVIRKYRSYIEGVLNGMMYMGEIYFKNAPKSSIPETVKILAKDMVLSKYNMKTDFTNLDTSSVVDLAYIDTIIDLIDVKNLTNVMDRDYYTREPIEDNVKVLKCNILHHYDSLSFDKNDGIMSDYILFNKRVTYEEYLACKFLLKGDFKEKLSPKRENWNRNLDKGMIVNYITSFRATLYMIYFRLSNYFYPKSVTEGALSKRIPMDMMDVPSVIYNLGMIVGLLDRHFVASSNFPDLVERKELYKMLCAYIIYCHPGLESTLMDMMDEHEADKEAKKKREKFTVL